ncbi:hypothetical protein DdX_19489 [Ditylenchus destructor]|uniref:Uncharacterized protein n=1 Tax=Ditylenchus destructor TaxID=166010 RepID=A0AAD4MIS4_9BILA|nr:hypothetical protein DdX_19489 [Ditylenchus destructor]
MLLATLALIVITCDFFRFCQNDIQADKNSTSGNKFRIILQSNKNNVSVIAPTYDGASFDVHAECFGGFDDALPVYLNFNGYECEMSFQWTDFSFLWRKDGSTTGYIYTNKSSTVRVEINRDRPTLRLVGTESNDPMSNAEETRIDVCLIDTGDGNRLKLNFQPADLGWHSGKCNVSLFFEVGYDIVT